MPVNILLMLAPIKEIAKSAIIRSDIKPIAIVSFIISPASILICERILIKIPKGINTATNFINSIADFIADAIRFVGISLNAASNAAIPVIAIMKLVND